MLMPSHSYNVRKSSKENFAFRCHRRERQPKPFSGPAPMDICAINDMAFNKTFGTVATLGARVSSLLISSLYAG